MFKKAFIIITCSLMSFLPLMAENAVVVIAHGAPMPMWRTPVLNLEKQLQQMAKQNKMPGISYVRVAMMEFSEPTIASVIRDCEKQGIDTVFAVPLFIAPSVHSEEDLPNMFSMKFNPQTIESLKAEKAEFISTKIVVIEGPTLSYGDILEKTTLDRVNQLSEDAKNEAVIILSHGDYGYYGYWKKKMDSIAAYIKKHSAIDYTDDAFVAMGYYLTEDLLAKVQKAAQSKKRIIIEGVYLVSSVEEMAQMYGIDKIIAEADKLGAQIILSKHGILPSAQQEVCNWVAERTNEWLENKNSVH